jgi:diguanylate cyclase (GGDEF)-like protein
MIRRHGGIRVTFLKRIDSIIGFFDDDPFTEKFSRERIRSVRQTIFVYYLAILLPFAAVAVNFPSELPTRIVGTVLLLAVVLRFKHWALPPPPEKREDVSPAAARLTAMMVLILSLAQAYFYLALSLSVVTYDPDGFGWSQIFGLGLLSGLIQGAALTGVLFASQVIFFCFLFPLVTAALFLFPAGNLFMPLSLAGIVAIGFYLAVLSHKAQLNLFRAQFDADAALERTEKANGELIEARRSAQYRSEFDALTGVRNRYAFMRDIEAQLDRGSSGVLVVIDLDRFKPINDHYGHYAGDIVLRFVARRLQRALPKNAIVGRLGGDEFAVFVAGKPQTSDTCELVARCDRALAQLRRPMRLSNAYVTIGGSAGGRIVEAGQTTVAQALQDADSALYVAKREGLETLKLFDDHIRDEAMRLAAIDTEMSKRDALDHFSLAYQPIVNLRTGEISSFEALARWHHPLLGEIQPSQFIAIAERNGLIREITIALLCKALNFAKDWEPPCRLSFNLSAAHICGDNAASEIIALVEASGIQPNRLQFEITETAMLINFDVARRNIEILREAGCRIALDDFGAGFASLVYLREIKFDKVKIDGSLIRGARDTAGRDMLNGVIKMLSAMKLESVAEYIATEADHETALLLGAEFGQGYFLGKPMRDTQVSTLLEETRQRALEATERRSGRDRRILPVAPYDNANRASAARFAG